MGALRSSGRDLVHLSLRGVLHARLWRRADAAAARDPLGRARTLFCASPPRRRPRRAGRGNWHLFHSEEEKRGAAYGGTFGDAPELDSDDDDAAPNLADAAVCVVLSTLVHLEHLDLGACDAVTDGAFTLLRARSKHV